MNPAPRLWRHPEFRRGATDMSALAMGMGAWGIVTGMAMAKTGMGIPLAVAMSLLVYAGSAQLAALPLLVQGAPLWVILATTFCVNLRFVVFSAGWRPYFYSLPLVQRMTIAYFTGDVAYITFMRRFPRPAAMQEQLAYFWGGVLINWTSWQALSLVGIALADVVPARWGIGFAGTLALVGLAVSLLVDRGTWLASIVAGCAAVAAMALPFHLNIVVAIAAAVAVGVVFDHYSAAGRALAPVKADGDAS